MLINFPPLKRWGLFERGAYLRRGGGGLNRAFTVYQKKKRTLSSAKKILKQIIHI